MAFLLYLLALIALATGTAAIYMALIKPFPVEWLYYHYFIRKPIVWTIFIGTVIWAVWESSQKGTIPLWSIIPIFLMGLAIALAYKMHQENAFPAVDFPAMADDISNLPMVDNMQLAIIEYDGITKAYPLDYVIHHHVINDRFGKYIVALTYCAMCRSIIPFDVTDIGPLFVGSFKGSNMIVADRKTKTFFQQATFESIIGKLHPHSLTMLPFQILPWKEVKKLNPIPLVAEVTEKDFREFQLPIPGIWKNIIASESTPGLPTKDRDKSFPARTHVVGVVDKLAKPQLVYLKEELLKQGIVRNEDLDIFLVAVSNTVNGFKSSLKGRLLNITLNSSKTLSDSSSGTVWNLRGKYISGEIEANLEPVALSDEYWFSWKRFHPTSKLIRV
ncbi:MAG: DUF3179 domain-containing protein [Chloroflexi bacterium]|nr:DUF3179 domain-containing protein [Chloroflexota bacterium]